MNRRGFFRILAGAAALAAGVKPLPFRPSSVTVYFPVEVTVRWENQTQRWLWSAFNSYLPHSGDGSKWVKLGDLA